MKKLYISSFLSIAAVLFLTSSGWTQINKNNLLINFGPSSGYGYPSGLTSTSNSGIPSLNLGVEYLITKYFSLGPYAAYTYSAYEFYTPFYPQAGYTDAWMGWDIGVRSTFHIGSLFIKNEKANLYLAAFTGYTHMSLVYDEDNIYRDSFNYNIDAFNIGGILGFRYFLSKRIGFYAEAGHSRKFFVGGGISYNINLIKK